MPHHFDDEKDMVAAHRDHASGGFGSTELEPVGSEPQISDWSPEHFDCYTAAAEACSRAPVRVIDDPRVVGVSPLLAAPYGHIRGFEARIASDNRCYLVGSAAIALGIVILLAGLFYFGLQRREPAWFGSAPAHVARNDSLWCSPGFGLGCSAQQKARKD